VQRLRSFIQDTKNLSIPWQVFWCRESEHF